MLTQKYQFDGNNNLSPIDISIMAKDGSGEKCFMDNIVVYQTEATISSTPMATVVSRDDVTPVEAVELPEAVLVAGKSRRSRKQKKRASKTKSKRYRKTARKQ